MSYKSWVRIALRNTKRKKRVRVSFCGKTRLARCKTVSNISDTHGTGCQG